MTHAPSLVTSSTVRKIVAGPGGYTLPLGGVTNVSDLRSAEMVASMKTRRALEWKAWLENPRSISDTGFRFGAIYHVSARHGQTYSRCSS